jgi:hypothetical protein
MNTGVLPAPPRYLLRIPGIDARIAEQLFDEPLSVDAKRFRALRFTRVAHAALCSRVFISQLKRLEQRIQGQ